MRLARITVFAGHFGSGKTSLAVAYALWAKQQRDRVILCDLDIINPYFRIADAVADLTKAGIGLIASRFANTNVEVPALPTETLTLFDDNDITGIIDLGGDGRGALVFGRYANLLQNSSDYEMLLVINQYRPLTRNLDDLCNIKNDMESASKTRFTGIVNNPNLAEVTTLEDVCATADFAAMASAMFDLPLKMTVVDKHLIQSENTMQQVQQTLGEIFPITLYKNFFNTEVN